MKFTRQDYGGNESGDSDEMIQSPGRGLPRRKKAKTMKRMSKRKGRRKAMRY